MNLSEKQLRYLRGRAHPLKPVIQIGQSGLTEGVVAETTRALSDHELIKVRVRGADRARRDEILQSLALRTDSALVVRIGHIAVLFKADPRLTQFPLPEA